MDIKRLRYFCTIVEQGQISRAAKALHMSQPPLSQRLKELEDTLETTLIVRSEGKWEVTEAGRMLYERAKIILSDLDNLKQRISDVTSQISGVVSIGVSTTCEAKLLNMIPALHEEFPGLHFRICVMDSSILEENIENKQLDIAILLLPLESGEFDLVKLPSCGFSVLFNDKLAFPGKSSLRLEDLAETPLVLSRRWRGGGHYDVMLQYWQNMGVAPKIILDTHHMHSLIHLLKVGLPAATIIPTSELINKLYKHLRILPLDNDDLKVHPVLITKKGRFLNRAVRMVVERITAAAT